MAPSHSLSKSLASVRRRSGGWSALAAVAAGGVIGSAARTGIGLRFPTQDGGFPTGVLLVNLVGSFLLGFYLARRERAITRRRSLEFWAIGVLGSFTTFSTFSLEVFGLLASGHALMAVSYVAASTIGGLAAALVGQGIGAASR